MDTPPKGPVLKRQSAGEPVYQQIREAIESGSLGPGEILASTRSLQSEFNVSLHAVVKGLDRLEKEGWIVRRRGSGSYVRDVQFNGRPHAPSKTIAVIAPEAIRANGFLLPLMEAARAEIESRGCGTTEHVLQGLSRETPEFQLDEDAAVWVCPSAPFHLQRSDKTPLVLVSPDCETISEDGSGYDIITTDSRQGGALAGRYLREVGCKRVVFVGVKSDGSGEWDVNSLYRLAGFQVGWGEKLSEKDLVPVPDYASVCGVRVAASVLNGDRPDGVFAASDDLAMGLSHGAIAHGVTLGEDMMLVGFDGQPPRFTGDPPLTTIAAPLEEMGRLAARRALERCEAPDAPMRRIALGCTLRKGDTA